VARILGDGKRRCTRAFTELVSHYLFQERFGRPGKGNDKGKVEALVKYSRANFLTPVPHAASFEALNATLEDRCRARQAERAGDYPYLPAANVKTTSAADYMALVSWSAA
jgi:transposase